MEHTQLMANPRSYIESTINACGRTYRIVVVDRAVKPFVVEGSREGDGEFILCGAFDSRADAIKAACDLSIYWITDSSPELAKGASHG